MSTPECLFGACHIGGPADRDYVQNGGDVRVTALRSDYRL
jgi:hypothetical protein